MDRVAIFVDAGYLFAQGSTALTGAKKPRSTLKINETAAVAELLSVANDKARGKELLRIYWYDGALNFRGPTLEQIKIADLDDVKLRLGFINSQGQQKGVDSLIVTDLIDLARNGAVSDAMLLSGDEDVRVGVQVAQNFGVRVHLIGIFPSRGSQSKQLLQEVDTTTEWNSETVSKFLEVLETSAGRLNKPKLLAGDLQTCESTAALDRIASEVASEVRSDQRDNLMQGWKSSTVIPSEFDGKLLGKARDALQSQLDEDQRRYIRKKFREIVGTS